MLISDWSSDVCSSDLRRGRRRWTERPRRHRRGLQACICSPCSARRRPSGLTRSESKGEMRRMRCRIASILTALAILGAVPLCATPAAADIEIDLLSRNPLMPAVRSGDVSAVRNLLLTGLSPDVADPQRRTALMYAAAAGDIGIVSLLIAHGASGNAEDARGFTALQEAGADDRGEVVAALLAAGARPDVTDRNGATPLMLAAASNGSRAVRTLLDAGADPTAHDYTGRSALDWARDRGNRRAERLLSEAGG